MIPIEEILENLNEKQLEAVTNTEGYVRVIAGAGSGKTKALTARYAYIVEALGINSSNVLCVTFTNKAAREMKTRVKRIVGENVDLSLITTYHGFCVQVLREDINKLQYPKSFIIMDVEDQKTVLREIFSEFGLTSRDFTFKDVLGFISKIKSQEPYIKYITNLQTLLQNRRNETKDVLYNVFIRYLEKQQRNFALDFNDLINFTLFIFENFQDVLEKWQKRLNYIQVDETQDSSPKQFTIVELLSQVHKNLFIVGDPDQTIYEWRGANPEILVNLDKRFPDTQTVIMNQNYRSTPNILNLGNHIIKNNKIRVDKDMFTTNQAGTDVVHFHAKSEVEEGLWITTEIQRLIIEQNIRYSDVAILYRAHYVSRVIEQSLIKEGIPYSIWGGIRFFERKEIKDLLSYLRLIVFGDDLSFLRIINTPSRKLGKVFIKEIKEFSEQNNITLFEALELKVRTLLSNRKGATEFVNLIKDFRKRENGFLVSDFIKEILDKTGLINMYRKDGDEDRLNNIKELQNSIIALESDDVENLTLENYLQEIALYTDMDSDTGTNDRVKLMTIHTAKGLEFPYVFLCGFTDGILPSYRSIKVRKERAIEEERRLTYVAITRAEKAFYMTESEGNNFQLGTYKHPSRFLFEIKENLFVRQGILPQEIIDGAKRQLEFEYEFSKHVLPVLEVGDIVSFSFWGEGKVLEKDEENKVYRIKFDKINAVRPIRFDWRGLRKIEKDEENSISITSDKTDDSQERIRSEYSNDIEGYWEEIEKLSNENKKY